MKTSSDAITRMSIPTCIMQLKVLHPGSQALYSLLNKAVKTYIIPFFNLQVEELPVNDNEIPSINCVNVELTKEKLETVLDGLGKIRDQLSSVAK